MSSIPTLASKCTGNIVINLENAIRTLRAGNPEHSRIDESKIIAAAAFRINVTLTQ